MSLSSREMSERKRAILDAVARWLDEHPDDPLPAGLDVGLAADSAPPPADLLGLVAAVTACRHDVQLQGKAFRRMQEGIAAMLATKSEPVAAAAPVDGELLMELYDRIERCHRGTVTARRDLPFFLTRRRAASLLAGIGDGLELSRGRLDELLADRDLQTFDPLGENFDPQRMRAVATRERRAGERTGVVVDTLAVGFTRNGTVVRPADVTLAR